MIKIKIENNRVIIPIGWKKYFSPNVLLSKSDISNCVNFANQMAYGKWYHNPNAFMWDYHRNNKEIFINALQWKLAEVAFYNFYHNKKPDLELTEPDFSVWWEGKREDTDIEINGKKISIKSTKHFGNLLLLECDRYTDTGLYKEPANWWEPVKHDLIYLVRIKWIDSADPHYYENTDIQAEITWYITHENFLEIIKSKQYIKKGSVLWIPLIVDNYYICTKDLNLP